MLKHSLDVIRELETELERNYLKYYEDFVRVEPVSKLYVEKLLKNYIKSDKGRFDPFNFIMIFKDENGRQVKREEILTLNWTDQPDGFKNEKYHMRDFTITDLFYQAAVESVKNRAVFLVRYPVLNKLNIFPSGINLMSTKEEDKNVTILYNFNIN